MTIMCSINILSISSSTVLAVGRCDGKVTIHSVEEGRTLHTHTFTNSVTSLHWVAQDQARYHQR